MARVRQLDAQHATERAHKTTKRVGAQVTDHSLFSTSLEELTPEAAERWRAALKITDRAASEHPCELDPAAGVTECTHPDHERDAEWAAVALDILGLPGEDLLDTGGPIPLEDYVPPFEVEQKKARLDRSAFPRPNWNWQDDAACSGESINLFYAPDGERSAEREIRERKAKRVCDRCPVLNACFTHAMTHNEKYGVWAGLPEDERAAVRRRWLRRRNAA